MKQKLKPFLFDKMIAELESDIDNMYGNKYKTVIKRNCLEEQAFWGEDGIIIDGFEKVLLALSVQLQGSDLDGPANLSLILAFDVNGDHTLKMVKRSKALLKEEVIDTNEAKSHVMDGLHELTCKKMKPFSHTVAANTPKPSTTE